VAQLSADLIKKIKGVKVLTVEDYSPADRQESSEEDGLVMMNMKSKLKKSEVAELINMAVKQAKGEDYEEEEEEEKPAPTKKTVSKTPRA